MGLRLLPRSDADSTNTVVMATYEHNGFAWRQLLGVAGDHTKHAIDERDMLIAHAEAHGLSKGIATNDGCYRHELAFEAKALIESMIGGNDIEEMYRAIWEVSPRFTLATVHVLSS